VAQALFSETGWIDGKRAQPENLEKRLQRLFPFEVYNSQTFIGRDLLLLEVQV
jgi:hypothetical protein